MGVKKTLLLVVILLAGSLLFAALSSSTNNASNTSSPSFENSTFGQHANSSVNTSNLAPNVFANSSQNSAQNGLPNVTQYASQNNAPSFQNLSNSSQVISSNGSIVLSGDAAIYRSIDYTLDSRIQVSHVALVSNPQADGENTTWQTQVVIANPSDESLPVLLSLDELVAVLNDSNISAVQAQSIAQKMYVQDTLQNVTFWQEDASQLIALTLQPGDIRRYLLEFTTSHPIITQVETAYDDNESAYWTDIISITTQLPAQLNSLKIPIDMPAQFQAEPVSIIISSSVDLQNSQESQESQDVSVSQNTLNVPDGIGDANASETANASNASKKANTTSNTMLDSAKSVNQSALSAESSLPSVSNISVFDNLSRNASAAQESQSAAADGTAATTATIATAATTATYDRASLQLTINNVLDKTIITLTANYSKNSTKYHLLQPSNMSGLDDETNASDENATASPFFTSNISDIILNGTQPYSLDLSSYISKDSGTNSSYSVLYTFLDNISIRINESQVVLIADPGYNGSQTLQFFIDNGEGIFDSNPINVTAILGDEANQTPWNATAQEQDTHGDVIAGKPVAWKKRIPRSQLNTTSQFYLPQNATNITVVLIDDIGSRSDLSKSAQLKKVAARGGSSATQQFVDHLTAASPFNLTLHTTSEEDAAIEANVENSANAAASGQASGQLAQPTPPLGLVDGTQSVDISATDVPAPELAAGNTTVLEINQSALQVAQATGQTDVDSQSAASDTVEIGYDIPGPTQQEVNRTSAGEVSKEVVISSDIHYLNISAQASLPIPTMDPRRVFLVWHQNISNVSVDSVLPYNLTSSGNGTAYDTIQWTVPHLSTQTFEIIVITQAEELDENRLPLRDVYGYVNADDGNATTIPAGHYVRVQFEKPLDASRDIKLFANPTISGTIGRVTVYEYNDTVPIATFDNISGSRNSQSADGSYDVLLTNLGNRTQDMFDLYIDGPDVDIDQIVDPLAVVTNPGMLIYAAGTTTTPLQYRLWNGTGFGANQTMLNASNTVEWTRLAASPTRYEYVAGTADSNNDVYFQVYFYNTSGGFCWGNGTVCGVPYNATLTGAAPDYQKIALQYEHSSGRAMAVFSINNATPFYTLWNGSVWTVPKAVNQTFLTGTVNQVRLAQNPNPNSNELALLMTDSKSNATLIIWNGTDWYCQARTSANVYNVTPYQTADLAYEQQSGDLFAAYGINGVANFDYITKPSGTCSFTQTRSPAQTERADQINIQPQVGSNFVALTFSRISQSDMIENIWNGTALLGQGPDETTVLTPVSPNLYFAPEFLGTSNVMVNAYGDAAASTFLRYMWYNTSNNVWTCGATGCAAQGITNYSGQLRSLQQYSFPSQNASLIFVRDTNNNLSVREATIATNGSPVFQNINGGQTLAQNVPSAAYPYTFNFAWQTFSDGTAPQIGYIGGALGTTPNGSNVSQNWIFINLSVNESNQANITFDLYNATSGALITEYVQNNTQYSVIDSHNLTGLTDGFYYFNATATDLNGNSASTSTYEVELDTTAPTLTYVSPTLANNAYVNTNFTIINVSIGELQPVNVTYGFNNSIANLYNASIALQYDFEDLSDFHESLTNIVDTSLDSDNGTSIGTTSWTTGQYGGALSFDGATGYVTTNIAFVNPQSFTLELWFKTNTAQGGRLIGFGDTRTGASANYDRHIYMLNNGTLAFGVYNGAVQIIYSKTNLNDNKWHQAIATLTAAGTISLYVDGVLQNTLAGVAGQAYTGYWRIGYDNLNAWTNQPTSMFFNGAIDAVRIYNVPISATEAAQHYQSTVYRTALFNWTLLSNTTNLVQTTYNYYACANDTTQHNACSSTQNITIDWTAPNISYVPFTDTAGTIVNRSWVAVNVTANDSNMQWINITLYNSTFSPVQSDNFTTSTIAANNSANFTGLADGLYYFNATSNDRAGNLNSTTTRNITIDTLPPQIGFYSLNTDPNSTYLNRRYIMVNVSVNESNLQNVTINLYNSTLNLINSSTNTTNGITTFFANFTVYADGMYWFNASAIDVANNTNRTLTYNVTVDSIPPNISYINFTEVAGSNLTRRWISINVTSNDTNFKNMNISVYNNANTLIWIANGTSSTNLTLNMTNLSDGLYYFNATATDMAGWTTSTLTRNVTIDGTAPNLTFVPFTETTGTTLNRNWMAINITANDTHLWTMNITIYNASFAPIWTQNFSVTAGTFQGNLSFNMTGLVDGEYWWNAIAMDTFGNLNTSVAGNLTLDTIRPNISYISITDVPGAIVNRRWIAINVTSNDTNFKNMNISVFNNSGSKLWQLNGTTSANLTLNFTTATDGIFYYNATALDRANWTNSTATRNITIDTIAPQIGFAAPTDTNSTYVNRNWLFVNVSINETNLQNTTIWLYNSTKGLVNTSTNTTYGIAYQQVNFTNLVDGMYYFNATVFDIINNTNLTGTYNITIDTTPPNISYIAATETPGAYLSRAWFIINVTSNDTNFKYMNISVYNSSKNLIWTANGTSSSAANLTLNFTTPYDGIFYFNATATDLAGWATSTATQNVTVDTVTPVISYVAYTDAAGINVTRNWIAVNASANDTNLASMNITIYNGVDKVIWVQNVTFAPGTTQGNISFNSTNLNLPNGLYLFNATAMDLSGRIAATATRDILIDSLNPNISFAATTEAPGANLSRNWIGVNVTANDSALQNITINLYSSGGALLSQTTQSTQNYDPSAFFIQAVNVSLDGSSAGLTTPAMNTNNGSTFIVGISWDAGSGASMAVTDNMGNVYTPISGVQNDARNAQDMQIFYSAAGVGGNGHTFTVTPTPATTFMRVVVHEVSSISPLNTITGFAANNTGVAGATMAGPVTPATNNNYYFGYIMDDNTAGQTISNISPFYQRQITQGAGGYPANSQDYAQVISNTTWSQWTVPSALSMSQIAAFQINRGSKPILSNESANFSGLADGVYFFNATAYDFSGDINFTTTQNVTIDTTPPNITFAPITDGPATYVARNWIGINVSANDTHLSNGGLGSLNITFYNATPSLKWTANFTPASAVSNISLNMTGLADGLYYFNATAKDSFGNVNTTITYNVTVDTTNPNISYIASTEVAGANLSRKWFVVNVTANDTNFAYMNISIYNSSKNLIWILNGTSAANLTLNFTVVNDGVYYFNATVTDSAGNTNSTVTRQILIDTTAPQVGYLAPSEADNSYISRDWIFINVSVNETNLSNVTIRLYNSSGSLINQSANFTNGITFHQANFTVYADGVYFFNATAWDIVNNVNSTTTRTVTVDTTIPLIAFVNRTEAEPFTFIQRNYIETNTSVTDTNFANISVYLYNSSGATQINISNSTSNPYFYNITNLPEGIYVFNASTFDLARNTNITDTRIVGVDLNNPTINYVAPTPNDAIYLNTNKTTINITTADTFNTSTYLDFNHSLLLYYSFSNWSGTSVVDDSSYRRNGTFNNSVTGSSLNPTRGMSANFSGGNNDAINTSASYLNGLTALSITFFAKSTATGNDRGLFRIQPASGGIESFGARYDALGNNSGNTNVITYAIKTTAGTWSAESAAFQQSTGWQHIALTWQSGEGVKLYINGSLVNASWNSSSTIGGSINLPDNTLLIGSGSLGQNWLGQMDEFMVYSRALNDTEVRALANSKTAVSLQAPLTNLSDGNYTYTGTAQDMSGRWSSLASRLLIIDTTPPNISYVNATETPWANLSHNWIIVNVTANDSNLANITIRLYNSTGGLINSSNSTSAPVSPATANFSGLADGLYFFNASATDLALWTTSTPTQNVTIDTLAPSINFVAPTQASGFITNQNFTTVNVTAVDVNLKNITIWLYNSSGSLINSSSASGAGASPLLANFTNLLDGVYFYNATAYDTAANLAITATRNITIDSVRPNISYTPPTETNNTYFNRRFILVNITANDAVALANTTIRLYNSTGSLINTSNTTAPSSPTGVSTNFANFTVYADGIYFFNATATDNATNTNSTLKYTVTVDTTNPNISYIAPTNITGINSTQNFIQINVSYNETNLQNVTIWLYNATNNLINSSMNNTFGSSSFFANFTNLRDGIYYYNATIIDRANLTNFTVTQNVTIDTIRPNISYIAATELPNASIQRFWFIVNVTANDTNFRYMNISIYNSTNSLLWVLNGTSAANLTLNFTAPYDGLFYYNATVTDWAGWTNNTQTQNVTIATSYPQIGFAFPTDTNSTYLNRNWIFVNVSINESFLQNVTIWLYNGSKSLINTSVNFTNGITYQQVNFTNLPDGQYYFNATAISLGNVVNQTGTYNVTIDTTRPNISYVSLTDPSTSFVSRNYILANVTANDTNFRYMNLSIYDSAQNLIWTINATNPTNLTLNFTVPADGLYYFNASVTDWAGWTNQTATNNVTVDTLFPQIAFVAPTPSLNTFLNINNVTINTTLTELNLKNFNFTWNQSFASIYDPTLLLQLGFNNMSGLGENAGTVRDSSQYNRSIILGNASIVSGGKFGTTAYFYNTATSFVNASLTQTAVTNYSVEAWIKTNVSQGMILNDRGLSGAGQSLTLAVGPSCGTPPTLCTGSANGKIGFGLDSNGVWTGANSAVVVNDGQWHHVIGVFSSTSGQAIGVSNFTIYVDGILQAGATGTVGVAPNSPLTGLTNTLIGYHETWLAPYSGYIDELRVWNRSLTQSQVTLLYQSSFVKYDADSYVFTANMTNQPDGTYNYQNCANDLAGNANCTVTQNVTFDTIRPNISYVAATEAAGANLSRRWFIVNITVNETNFVASNISIFNSTGSLIWIANSTTLNNTLNFTAPYDGVFYFNSTATDFVNWTNSTPTRQIFIDTLPPQIGFAFPTETNSTYLNRNWIFVNVSVNETNLTNVTIWLYNASKNLINSSTNTTISGTTFQQVNFTNLPDGQYYFNATAFDVAGNMNQTGTYNVTIDTIRPNISYITITDVPGANVSRRWIAINVTANDTNFRYMNISVFNSTNNLIWIQNGTSPTNLTLNFTTTSDGVYYYNATVTDWAGWTNSTLTQNITIDTAAPQIGFAAPTDTNSAYLNRNWIFANVSVNDTNLKNVTIWLYNGTNSLINSSINTTISGATYQQVNFTNLPDGIYHVNATAFDFAGNMNFTTTYTLTVDTIRPNISFIAATEIAGANLSRRWIIVNVTANDTNFANMNISVYNSSNNLIWIANGTTAANLTLNFTTPADGVYYFNATVTDFAGWTNSTITQNVTIDTLAPQIGFFTINTDGNSTYLNRRYVLINVSINESNLQNVTINLYNSTLNLINSSTNTTNGITTFFANFTVSSDGMYWFNATAYDIAGNFNRTFTYNVTIDTTPPNISYIAITDIAGANVSRRWIAINVTANDTNFRYMNISVFNSTNNLIWIQNATSPTNLTLNFTAPADGIYYYNATVTDWVGLTASTATRNITIDITAPNLTYVPFTETAATFVNRNWLAVNITANDTHLTTMNITIYNASFAPIWTQNFTVAGGATQGNLSFNITLPVDGEYWYNAIATDTFGNTNTTAAGNVTIDTIRPNISYIAATEVQGANLSRKWFVVNVTANDTNFLNMNISVFNSSGSKIWQLNGTSPTNLTLNFTTTSDGVYYFNATALDRANWTNSTVTQNVTIDTVAPQIGFAAPTDTNNAYLNRNWIFANVSVNDTNLQNVTIWLYNSTNNLINSSINTTISGATYQQVNFTNLPDGIYRANATAFDFAGNTNFTTTYTFTVDTTPPNISYIAATEIAGANLSRRWIIINVTANDTNFKNMNISIYNSSQNLIWQLNGTTAANLTLNFTAPSDGLYYFNATVTDLASWINFTTTRNVTIDTLAPQIGFATPTLQNNAYINRTWIFINVSVNESNLQNITIRLYNVSGSLINQSANFTNGITYQQVNFTNLADGQYFYNATAWDFAGNLNSTTTNSITLDNINPTAQYVAPSYPAAAWFNTNSVSVNVTAADTNFANTQITLLNMSLGVINSSINSSTTAFIKFTNVPDGMYFYNATTFDLANNFDALALRQIFIDTVSPTLQFVSPTPANNVYSAQNWVFINTTSSDATSNSTSVHLDWNHSLVLYYPLEDWASATTVLDNSSWGNNGTFFGAAGRTIFGARGAGAQFNGTTPTNISVPESASLDLLTGGTVEAFIYAQSGADSAFPRIVCKESTTSQGGSYCLELQVGPPNLLRMGINAVQMNSVHQISFNQWYHVAMTWNGTTWCLYINGTQDSCAANAGLPVAISQALTIGNSPFGPRAWNGSIDEVKIFNRALSAQEIAAEANASFAANQLFVNMTNLADGVYSYYAQDVDEAANYNRTATRTVTIDTIKPNISYIAATEINNSNLSRHWFVVNVSANDTNFAYMNISVYNSSQNLIWIANGTTAANLTLNFSAPSDGIYYFNATATDLAGNTNSTPTRQILLDTTAPQIGFFTINTDGNSTYHNRRYVLINVSINETNLQNVTINLYNSTLNLINSSTNTTNGITTFFANFTVASDGNYWFNATAYDTAGNYNQTFTYNVTLDSTAPNISYIPATETPGALLARPWFIVNVTANDSNFRYMNISIFNSSLNNIWTLNGTNPANLTLNFTAPRDGIYYFNATVTDYAGNTNSTLTQNVTIDTTAPAIQYVPITEADQSYLNQTFIRVNISTVDANFANVTIFLYNSSGALINSITNLTSGNQFANFTNLAEGVYYFNATAFDLALNHNSTITRKVIIDPNFPQIEFIYPTSANGSTVLNTTQIINVSVNETFLQDFNAEFNTLNTSFINSSTVLFLNFNNVSAIGDTAATVMDLSGYLNNATCNGGCNYTAGRYGLGIGINNTNNTLRILDSPTLDNTNHMSWEFWFNAATLDGNPRGILSKRQIQDVEDSYSFFLWTGNKLDIDIDSTNDRFATNKTFVANTWYHVVVTYDGTAAAASRVRVYVNGTLDTIGAETSAAIPNYNSNITIGALNENYGNYFNGTIDEVRIYNTTLSANDVLRLSTSNLQRVNATSWDFESTQANLSGTNTYRACAVDFTRDINCTSLRTFTINSTAQVQLQLTNITFSNSTAIEGQNTTVRINVSNLGIANATNVTVQFNISLWNGTKNLLFTTNFTGLNISSNSSQLLLYNWTVQVGTFQFDAMVDPANVIIEANETDNAFSANYTTSSWTIYYGNVNYGLALENNINNTLRNWSTSGAGFNLYYADTDAVYNPSSLKVFNQTNAFNLTDSALNISGYNDSVGHLFDKNGDGTPDQTTTFVVGGVTLNNVPYINSTNTSSFITGILWDGADGANFNGSQDIIFITRVNASKVGSYGTYDYEIRVPSGTRKLKPSTDTVSQLVELT